MAMQKILIIEDNNEINHMLCEWFEENGYITKAAFSGTEGLLYSQLDVYDVIILDLMLPGMSGEEVLKKIREKSDVPVIVASAKTDIEGKVELLENGADDYVTKPFDLREVLARVRLKCSQSSKKVSNDKNIKYGGIEIDTESYRVHLDGNELVLTKQEYGIVYELFSKPQKTFTKEELFSLAWDDYYEGADKTMNVHISNIRAKIKNITNTSYIDTVWGIGYRASKLIK